MLEPDDVIRANPPAGGGWGDPLDRSVEDVERDLADGAISPASAKRHYGCDLRDDETVDAEATSQNRERIRNERKAWPARRESVAQPHGSIEGVCPMGDQLFVGRDAAGALWTMCRCGRALAPASENWREYAGRRVALPEDLGMTLKVHESMEVRRYSCLGCGRTHAVDVCRKGSPDPHDIKLDLVKR